MIEIEVDHIGYLLALQLGATLRLRPKCTSATRSFISERIWQEMGVVSQILLAELFQLLLVLSEVKIIELFGPLMLVLLNVCLHNWLLLLQEVRLLD